MYLAHINIDIAFVVSQPKKSLGAKLGNITKHNFLYNNYLLHRCEKFGSSCHRA